MPPVPAQRPQPPSGGRPLAHELQPGRVQGGRGGIFDSSEREPPATRRPSALKASEDLVGPLDGSNSYDPAGDGRGGLAGLRDPYDKPTRSQLMGAQSRLRQDKASGALDEVAGRYRVLYGAHHLVRKGLRRSIADAYAAYVGQVVRLPEDSYGLALRALDRSVNGAEWLPPGGIDDRLHTSPFATSRAKHAQIFNTAHKIMRDLGGYVYDVSYYCPGELDQLREMRRPGAESYKAGTRVGPTEAPPEREAVGVAPRPSSVPSGRVRRAASRPRTEPPDPAISPITGAIRQSTPTLPPELRGPRRQTAAVKKRPAAAAGSGGGGGNGMGTAAAAAVARSGGTALSTAAAVEAAKAEAGEPEGGGRLELEDRRKRNLRRRSSPAMYVNTPPYLLVSRFYDHVTPTQEILELMRRRTLRAEQEQVALAEEKAAAAAAAGSKEAAGGGRSGDAAGIAAAARRAAASRLAVAEPAMARGARSRTDGDPFPAPTSALHQPPLRDGPRDMYGGGAGHVRRSADSSRHASPDGGAKSRSHVDATLNPDPDPAGTARILWIIETAYELGLAEALGLEGPLPYPRSERLHPLDHRRQFYEAVYSSPERYASYAPYTPPADEWDKRGPEAPAAAADGYFHGGVSGRHYKHHATSAREPMGGGAPWPYEYDSRTAQQLEAAAARLHAREAAPMPAAKLHPRSRRLAPH